MPILESIRLERTVSLRPNVIHLCRSELHLSLFAAQYCKLTAPRLVDRAATSCLIDDVDCVAFGEEV